ncbi:MAG: hypothetical protein EZS28_055204, partial [Streblomastix strix]
MSKKPTDGKKKKKKVVDPELEGLKDLDKKGKQRILALEKELFQEKENTRLAMKKKNEFHSKVLDFSEQFNQEKADRFDVMQNMTRQYKEMQDYLIVKNTELAKKIE